MDGDSISGAIRRSQKGLERGQRLPFKKESLSPGVNFDTFWLRRYDRSTIAPVYKSMNAKNATDFSFDYSIRCPLSNRTPVRRKPWNLVGCQSLRKMRPEVRRQKKSCVRMTITIDRKDITVLAFLSLYLVCPSPQELVFGVRMNLPRKERKYRALLSEEVFPCAARWPGSAEEQNICHSPIEFRLGDIHQWIYLVLRKEENI